MSANMPSIGFEIPEIAVEILEFLRKSTNYNFKFSFALTIHLSGP